MTDADSGSDDEQVTTPVENPSDSGNGGGANTNPTESKATYTITFDANGGSGAMNPQIFTYGEPQNLSPNEFTMENKDFLGWATSADGSIAYDDNSGYTIGAADVTLYAVWGKLVTADNAATVIAGLEGGTRANPNVYMIKITDKTLTAEQLKEIGTAIETVANKSNYYAFFSLDLSSATEVTEIPEEAFSTCRLRRLILPDSLETIGIGAFGYNNFEEIVIPDNVKTIADGGFEYCSDFKTITLPASLTSIGASAFKDCINLKTVYYKGTQAQWEILKTNISTTGNDKVTGAKIICTDTAL